MSPAISLCLLVAVVTVATKASVQDTCPSPLVDRVNNFYLQVRGDVCFHFVVNYRRTFQEASEDCKQDGGTLAMPKNLELNKYLTDKSYNHYGVIEELWIGLTDIGNEDKFKWADGSEVAWTHFAKGNGPTNNWFIKQLEDCVALDPIDGFWHDFLCNDDYFSAVVGSEPKKSYICQYEQQFEDDLGDLDSGAK